MSLYELLIILQHLREELQVTHDAITARMEIEKERERNAGHDGGEWRRGCGRWRKK